MTSDESDDEPLSVIATNKKENPDKYAEFILPEDIVLEPKKKKKRKIASSKGLSVTILQKKFKRNFQLPVKERPLDVWLYLKDLNATGPYSCLLCPDWFINRSKLIIHYVLNHKKDFCGICRYFVPDREAWLAHANFHTPWPCSLCIKEFDTESELREHLSSIHKFVHCYLCHFRIPDNDQYTTHLYQKHNVTNVPPKNDDILWQLDSEDPMNFQCLLCSKPDNPMRLFFSHYMGFHHFTLKCFTQIISGSDAPFLVDGADLSPEFIDTQLSMHPKFGYVDLDITPEKGELVVHDKIEVIFKPHLKVEKIELLSDPEEAKPIQEVNPVDDSVRNSYEGDEDFDVTLMEILTVKKCYSNYVASIISDMNSNVVSETSLIQYDKTSVDVVMNQACELCKTDCDTELAYTSHMAKMHSVKVLPIFSCRVCTAEFDTQAEMENHMTQELGDFEDLWLCQFCDKEFDNREKTRVHLTEHLNLMEFDNCFSPHLGFKCKYCPTLFWNETDRETHHVQIHYNERKEEYYQCESCKEVFSDKIWFSHHFLNKHSVENGKDHMCLYKCCLCCLVLPTVEVMRNHFDTKHSDIRKVFCSLDPCQYKPLSHRKSFKLHLKTMHNPALKQDRPVNCTLCNREFANSRAYRAHVGQAHGSGKYKCKLCREMLRTMDERKLHYLIRHPGQHPFECKQCGKSFQYKSSLYVHKQQHLPNKKNYACEYCNKLFAKKDSYREHMLIHEGPRHACSYCPKRFVQRSNMLRHERRHTGERPYTCPHCPRTFSDKGACTSHVRTHSKESAFGCMYCGQTFVQKSKLTYHIRKHTGENLETCSVCSKLFTSACALREHMKIHEPKKKLVKCPLCDKSYQDERYMLRHLDSSHAQHQYPCPVCRKLLSSAAGRRHHVLTHTDINTYRCKLCPNAYAVKKTVMRHLRKRHGFKGNEINIKDFFRRLDPRECKLGLDEKVMTDIFGPPKRVMSDILLGDFVNADKRLKHGQPPGDKFNERDDVTSVSHSQDDDSQECDREGNNERRMPNFVAIKTERDDSDNGGSELEPTDFVSVKIEPMDEDSDSGAI